MTTKENDGMLTERITLMDKKKKQLVIIINGRGGVGKDTLCEMAAKHFSVRNISSITPIKEIALQNGWKGDKTKKSRKFLSDLKRLFVEYNDLPTKYLVRQYREFMQGEEQILFVHIRETEEIDKFKREVSHRCITLLVKRDKMRRGNWGNASDDEVENYAYDFYFQNDKPLPDVEKEFVRFIEERLRE